MRKKDVFLPALILALATLCGCAMPWQSSREEAVITVSDAEIGADLYALYLTQIFRDPEKFGLADTKRDAAEKKAVELCTQYVAVNTAFRDAGLRLTPAYKTRIAENVSVKWSFYKKYYESVGIRKQTLTQYETAEAKRELMIAHKYGKGGEAAVSDIELDAYYAVNYVTFQRIPHAHGRGRQNGASARRGDHRDREPVPRDVRRRAHRLVHRGGRQGERGERVHPLRRGRDRDDQPQNEQLSGRVFHARAADG